MRKASEGTEFELRTLEHIPKSETHLHLEPSVSWDFLCAHDPRKRFALNDAPAFINEADFRWGSFEEFLSAIGEYIIPFFRERGAEGYRLATEDLLSRFDREGVCYAEITFHFGVLRSLPGQGEAILQAIRDAARKYPKIRRRIFAGLCRDDDQFPDLIKQLEESLGWGGLDGYDLYGDERLPLKDWVVEFYERAREAGKFTKAHAGELCGPKSVREVIEKLGVTRIEHGIRAIEDAAVIQLIREKGITLDVCPTSNYRLNVVQKWREHPLPKLMEAGINCTVSSDDRLLFHTDMVEEYRVLAREMNLDAGDLAEIAMNGFRVALTDDAWKEERMAEINARLDRFREPV